jgi:hypothetical protein
MNPSARSLLQEVGDVVVTGHLFTPYLRRQLTESVRIMGCVLVIFLGRVQSGPRRLGIELAELLGRYGCH